MCKKILPIILCCLKRYCPTDRSMMLNVVHLLPLHTPSSQLVFCIDRHCHFSLCSVFIHILCLIISDLFRIYLPCNWSGGCTNVQFSFRESHHTVSIVEFQSTHSNPILSFDILWSTTRFSKWSFPFRFSSQHFVLTSYVPVCADVLQITSSLIWLS